MEGGKKNKQQENVAAERVYFLLTLLEFCSVSQFFFFV